VDRRYRVLEPVCIVDPGETVVVETINHMTPVVQSEHDLHAHGSPGYREREETGPIFVRGARLGDTLQVHIENIEPVGFPHAHGSGPLADLYPQEPLLFPVREQRCLLPGGISLPLAPMIGDIYTTPATPEPAYPDHGGNMDYRGIRPGATLYLPVYHEGALLVLGDVHALQGEGELYGEGAETAADVTVTIDISSQHRCLRPLVETVEALVCLGSRASLFAGLRLVVQDMVELLCRRYNISAADAYVLCTLAGSVHLAGSLARQEWLEEWPWVALSVSKDICTASW
jgi:amidase